MLFRCNCNYFNPLKNSYRDQFNNFGLYYLELMYQRQHASDFLIILFEPGGLLDEFNMLQSFFDYITISSRNQTIQIKIIIVEPMIDNINIQNAQKYFIDKLQKYKFITISITLSLRLSKIKFQKAEVLFISCLDPYYFECEYFFKNIKNDINYLSFLFPNICFSYMYLQKNKSKIHTIIWEKHITNSYKKYNFYIQKYN